MPHTAPSAAVLAFGKDPERMSDLELYGYIQYLKRCAAMRATARAECDLSRLSDAACQAVEREAESDRRHLANLDAAQTELRRIYGIGIPRSS